MIEDKELRHKAKKIMEKYLAGNEIILDKSTTECIINAICVCIINTSASNKKVQGLCDKTLIKLDKYYKELTNE